MPNQSGFYKLPQNLVIKRSVNELIEAGKAIDLIQHPDHMADNIEERISDLENISAAYLGVVAALFNSIRDNNGPDFQNILDDMKHEAQASVDYVRHEVEGA